MTKEARLTRKRMKGEILKLLEGKEAGLFQWSDDCEFCQKYRDGGCEKCPLYLGNNNKVCNHGGEFMRISTQMMKCTPLAIPGALAIYMWLFGL